MTKQLHAAFEFDDWLLRGSIVILALEVEYLSLDVCSAPTVDHVLVPSYVDQSAPSGAASVVPSTQLRRSLYMLMSYVVFPWATQFEPAPSPDL